MNEEFKILGDGIKHFRKLRGYSRVDFAKLLNISPYLLDKMERGERSAKGRLDTICKYLCVTKEEIYLYKPRIHVDKTSAIKRLLKNKRSFVLSLIAVALILAGITLLYVIAITSKCVEDLLNQSNEFSFNNKVVYWFHVFRNAGIIINMSGVVVFVINSIFEVIHILRFEKGRTTYVDLNTKKGEQEDE